MAKIALDITAKYSPDNIGYLDLEEFKKQIWHHRPITDIQECSLFLYFHPSIWSCIYKREFLEKHNIRFVEAKGAGWTDNPFQVQTMCLAEKIFYTPQAYYYWRKQNDDGK